MGAFFAFVVGENSFLIPAKFFNGKGFEAFFDAALVNHHHQFSLAEKAIANDILRQIGIAIQFLKIHPFCFGPQGDSGKGNTHMARLSMPSA